MNYRPPEFKNSDILIEKSNFYILFNTLIVLSLNLNLTLNKVISLDSLSKFDISCLYQFQFTATLNNPYSFSIQAINNFIDTKLFHVNKSTNCLSLNINSEINLLNGSIPGVHLIQINVTDYLGGFDSMMFKIYLIESCHQRIFLTTAEDSQTVRDNLGSYKK